VVFGIVTVSNEFLKEKIIGLMENTGNRMGMNKSGTAVSCTILRRCRVVEAAAAAAVEPPTKCKPLDYSYNPRYFTIGAFFFRINAL